MRRPLSNKRILITGASSGLGRALALEAGRRGARLVLAARSQQPLESLAEEIRGMGAEAVAVTADVTLPEHRQAMLEANCRRFGGLDILVNNAGVAAHGHFIDLDPDVLRRIMEVNFFALAETCRLAIPVLAEGEQPLIVNIGSMAGRRGVPAWTEYSASKFAVAGFSEALRAELVRFAIDLLLVVPGLIRTELGRNMLARKGRLPIAHDRGIEASTAARRILDAMQRNRKELRLERDARLLLLANRFLPRFVDWRMAQVVRRLYAAEIAALSARRSRRS